MKELAYFDPLKNKYPVGVICKNHSVKFIVEVDKQKMPNIVYLLLKDDNGDYQILSMQNNNDVFEIEVNFQSSGHYFYCFKLVYDKFEKYLCKTFDNYSIVLDYKGEDFFQSVIEKEYTCKSSMQGGIIYQIMVDRFCKVGDVEGRKPLILRNDWGGDIKKYTSDPLILNQEVFGGNFEGIISKLNYLKSLGITIIYLNPICLANSHHKYDTANYMIVDGMFGGEQKFQKLIKVRFIFLIFNLIIKNLFLNKFFYIIFFNF